VRDRIVLEVNQALTQYLQAQENLDILREGILPQLEDAVERAEEAYGAGNISFLLVLETTRRLLETRLSEVEADASLRRARAELERSVGRRLEDAHQL
jgi:cobalt-zinc-cadmium efflux system outer membrane protein